MPLDTLEIKGNAAVRAHVRTASLPVMLYTRESTLRIAVRMTWSSSPGWEGCVHATRFYDKNDNEIEVIRH